MALLPFRTESDTYSTSVTMDASTVGDTTVTAAVYASRELEPAILEAIYDHGSGIEFKPFYNKANDYEHAVRRDFTEVVLQEFPEHIRVFSHRQSLDGNEDTQQVEAVYSAIHVHNILNTVVEPPAVIVDGKSSRPNRLSPHLEGCETIDRWWLTARSRSSTTRRHFSLTWLRTTSPTGLIARTRCRGQGNSSTREFATGSRRSARPPSSWRPQSTSRRHSGRSGPWSELEAVVG